MKNDKTVAAQRAKELLAKMTLEEKVGQLCLFNFSGTEHLGIKGESRQGLAKKIAEGGAGALIQPCRDLSECAEALQRVAVEESRLGIPLLFNCDVIHGFETIFPIPLAAACSFDTELVEKTAEAAAFEAGMVGINYTNAPMIDVARDPRWGRIAESPGEDAYLAGEMAKAYVRGFQKGDFGILSTLKHYAGYGCAEGGRDYGTSEVCENTMLNEYLPPFREGVKAGAASVMSAFSTIENIPATGNKKYLREILRGKFGFDGIVISDSTSVPEMMAHGYCESREECTLRALEAGVDIELSAECYPENLSALAASGKADVALLDEAVLRILTKKFELGLFDDPYRYFTRPREELFSAETLDLSEKLASESAVLLENNGLLPLPRSAKIAVVGSFAKSRDFLGCWQDSKRKEEVTPLFEALKRSFDVTGVCESYRLSDVDAAVYGADAVVFTFGEGSAENGEAASKYNLKIDEKVVNCFHYLKSRGMRVIALAFAGRPLIVNDFKYADALMYCWSLGHRAGETIDKLLVGEYVPSGKLTATIPRDEGQLPIYYCRKPSGRPFSPGNQGYRCQNRYDDGNNYPQYPFGYGLSYAKFRYGKIRLDSSVMRVGGVLRASVEIENAGEYDGTEVVQLYIRDCAAEVVRPVRELKGFKRVFIGAGKREEVSFEIDEELLKYYHPDGSFSADCGKFIAYIGGSSGTENGETFELKK